MNKHMDPDKEILLGRYLRAVDAMRENGICLWISCGRESHILGEPALMFLIPMAVLRRTALILTSSGERVIVCGEIEAEEFESMGLFTRIEAYAAASDYEPLLAKVLRSLMPASKVALNVSGFDPSSDGMSHSDFMAVTRLLSDVGFGGETVSSQPIMKAVRGRRSDAEIKKLKHAADCAMRIYRLARPKIKIGMSARDIQSLFQSLVSEAGYGWAWDADYNPYVYVGTKSSYNCKMPPDDVFVEPGDVVNIDFGIRVDGWATDNQRTFYALRDGETEPPYEVRRAFSALQEVNRRVTAAMKPGIDSSELAAPGNLVMEEYGYDKRFGGYGHELGLFAHNGGICAGQHPANIGQDATLEENMTFTLEPAIITPFGRVCQEEVVCVGSGDGGFMLSTPQSEIWLIEK